MTRDSEIPSGTFDAGENTSEHPLSPPNSGGPSSASDMERRVATRHPLVHFVWFKLIEDDQAKTQDSPEGIAKLADISETGVGLHVTTPIPVGKTAFIEIVTKKFSLSCIGQIVYARKANEKYHRIGIHFTIVPPNDRLLLSRFLATTGEEQRGVSASYREDRG